MLNDLWSVTAQRHRRKPCGWLIVHAILFETFRVFRAWNDFSRTMDIQYHILGFTRIDHHKHAAAIRQTKMSQFNDLQYAAQHDRFLAPVKLAGLAHWESQQHKGLFNGWILARCFFQRIIWRCKTVYPPEYPIPVSIPTTVKRCTLFYGWFACNIWLLMTGNIMAGR